MVLIQKLKAKAALRETTNRMITSSLSCDSKVIFDPHAGGYFDNEPYFRDENSYMSFMKNEFKEQKFSLEKY